MGRARRRGRTRAGAAVTVAARAAVWVAWVALWIAPLALTCMRMRDGYAAPTLATKAIEADRARLKALAATFPHASQLDIVGVVDDIVKLTSDPTEQRFLLGWGYFESFWGKFPLGDCTCWAAGKKTNCPHWKDRSIGNCKSFGVLQVRKPQAWLASATPNVVIANRVTGLQVGLLAYRACLKATKFDERAALRLYSSGSRFKAFSLVAHRCSFVGC